MKRQSKTTNRCIKDLAAHYDETGKPEVEITVNASRRTLLRDFKPAKRGGPLHCGRHLLRYRGFSDPAPEQLDVEREAPPKPLAGKRRRKAAPEVRA